jgi:hypothetical protein
LALVEHHIVGGMETIMRNPIRKAALILSLIAACAGLLLIVSYAPIRVDGDIVAVYIGGPESHPTISSRKLRGIETSPESLTFESRADLDGDSLRVVLHYQDTVTREFDGCFAEYRGVTYNCNPGYHYVGRGVKAGASIPGSLGLSAEKIAELRGQDIPGQWGAIEWLLIGAGITLLMTINIVVVVWKRMRAQNWKKPFVAAVAGVLSFVILSQINVRLLMDLGFVD